MGIVRKSTRLRLISVVLLATVAAPSLQGCSRFAGFVANSVYPALDEAWDPENAPTVASPPASADIRAVIGGRGEGLNCSIPALAENLMFGSTADRTPIALQFRQACVFHDYCYRHGHATYGYQKLDCDVLLQQHAYRLCRRIYRDKLSLEECRERARVVLLGVNAFGGTNFQHGHRSSYFEFDPFPQRANDYVAARLVRHREARGEVIRSDSEKHSSSLWVFAIKDGWISIRDRRFESSTLKEAPSSPFLREKVASPPHVLRAEGGDRLVWLARRSLANTGIHAVAINATSGAQVVRTLAELAAEPATQNTVCAPQATPKIIKSGAPGSVLEFDCDTAVARPVTVECSPQHDRTVVFAAWGSRSTTADADPCAGTDHGLAVSAHSVDRNTPHRRYRLAQDQLITGHFGGSGRLDFVTLSHGLAGDTDYRSSASALRVGLGRAEPAEAAHIPVPEEFEPFAPYRATGESRDRLLALRLECKAKGDCAARAVDLLPSLHWTDSGAWQQKDVALDVGAGWLRQPAQVVAPIVRGEGDWLVLSRVSDGLAGGLDEPDYAPRTVRLEYKALKRTADGWTQRGGACMQVDIREQVRANPRAVLANRYFTSAGGKEADASARAATLACADADDATVQGNPTCLAMLRDFAARWHRSQVIPGYVQQLPETTQAGRVPEAVFVYNGFTAQSLTLGDEAARPAWAKPCEAGGYEAAAR
ncbi:MAG: hypothetical protein OEL20_03170 [Sulfuritalea sp.]|nr:hypothetical protein [Sulfuritalea sp.]